MKYFSYLFLISLSMALLVSCSSSDAEKMFGTWTGSTSDSNGERFIKLKITKDNRFELYDSCVFNQLGDPTIANYYSGLIDGDGAFSIYKNHPWAGPSSINLKSRSGYTHNYLSGEEAYVKTLETHDPELETLGVYSKGGEEEDPNIDGWFIRTGWFDAVYFNTIGWRGSTGNLNKLKLTKQNQKIVPSTHIEKKNDVEVEAILETEILEQELNQEGLINVSNLNFRSSPEITNNIIGRLDKGDRVIILDKISGELDENIKGLLTNSISVAIDGVITKINKGKALNILNQDGDNIICEIDLGKSDLSEIVVSSKDVEILNEEAWVKIQKNETIGYVYARFIDE
tara:strand:- start:115 stop:1143 length:1029 start_codon:yes stop_codon:yes gene_type:complete